MGSANSGNSVRLILASGSPRRRELLEKLGLKFEIQVSDLDESTGSEDPATVVKELAEGKALAVADSVERELKTRREDISDKRILLLGADTIVVLGKEILGKPQDKAEAVRMLAKLSSNSHQVFTGVSLVELPGRTVTTIYAVTDVHFRVLNEREIEAYVETGEPMDKAGAYALQGIASAFVRKIDGCYTNVIGLPIPDTVRILRERGVEVLGMGAGGST